MWAHYQDLNLEASSPRASRNRYSVTADILAYQQCPLQYSAFTVRGYQQALVPQLFYGTVIHQVLDRAHGHFAGRFEAAVGSLPTDEDIERYFRQVELALRARRIRAVQGARDQALEVIKRFNALEGPTLYPRIVDTECRLQANQGAYILHGNVDVLASPEDGEGVELWDYKGSEKPSMASANYERYVFQMQVYAHLYKQKTNTTPTKAILYFLNELGIGQPPGRRPANAVLEVNLNDQEVQRALTSFGETVGDIELHKMDRKWPNPVVPPEKTTCDACDLRWDCSAVVTFGRDYPMRHP